MSNKTNVVSNMEPITVKDGDYQVHLLPRPYEVMVYAFETTATYGVVTVDACSWGDAIQTIENKIKSKSLQYDDFEPIHTYYPDGINGWEIDDVFLDYLFNGS